MSERGFNRNESVIPRQPSNRRLIEQMILWGWTPHKSGKYTTMRPPIGNETVDVQPAQKHDANATSIFLAIYRLTTQGDADLFWRGPSDLWLEMLAEQREAERKKREKMNEPRGQQATPTTPLPLVQQRVEPAAPPSTKGRPGYFTGKKFSSTKSVLEVLANNPSRSMDAEAICKKLGLDPDVLQERRSVSNTLSLLYKKGEVRRMKVGFYRSLPVERPTLVEPPTTTSAGTWSNSEPITVQAPPSVKWVGMSDSPDKGLATVVVNNSAFRAVKPAEESVDDVIEAVLDLLLPKGFKAQDLRVITPWVEATKKMVGAVAR